MIGWCYICPWLPSFCFYSNKWHSLCSLGQLDSLTHDENKYCMWETLSCHLGREGRKKKTEEMEKSARCSSALHFACSCHNCHILMSPTAAAAAATPAPTSPPWPPYFFFSPALSPAQSTAMNDSMDTPYRELFWVRWMYSSGLPFRCRASKTSNSQPHKEPKT